MIDFVVPMMIRNWISEMFMRKSIEEDETVLEKTFASDLIKVIGTLIILALQVYPKEEGLGKYLLGMKLVDEKGADADYGMVVLRGAIKYLYLIVPILDLLYDWFKLYFILILKGIINVVSWGNLLVGFVLLLATDRFSWEHLTHLFVVEKTEKQGNELFVAG